MNEKADFRVKDTGCVCDGLNAILEMATFYRDYATDTKHIPQTPETKRTALRITKSVLSRLTPEHACTALGQKWIEDARIDVVVCEREGEQCMAALEHVRAAIHEDMCLDAQLTCQKWQRGLGSDFVEAQPWNDIRWSMYGLAHFGLNNEQTAVDTLRKSLRKNRCRS